jgi:CRP/FNR family transcriptional regulator, cyclic AMP receptor protein
VKLPNIFEKPDVLKSFTAGQTIFEAGQAADFMYVVKTGKVDLFKDGRLLETVGPEGFFGELALVDNSPRSATAKAQTDCSLAPINEKQFLFMVGETPFFALDIMRGLAVRLRRA